MFLYLLTPLTVSHLLHFRGIFFSYEQQQSLISVFLVNEMQFTILIRCIILRFCVKKKVLIWYLGFIESLKINILLSIFHNYVKAENLKFLDIFVNPVLCLDASRFLVWNITLLEFLRAQMPTTMYIVCSTGAQREYIGQKHWLCFIS